MSKILNFKNVADRKIVEVYNKGNGIVEMTLYGVVGESYWEEGVSAKDFQSELNEIPKDTTEIHLRINSPGGSVFDGMTIHNLLKQHSAKVIAYVDGIAASIASVIMLAADEVVIGEGAMVMIHKPLTGVYGNSEQLDRTIMILDKIEDQMTRIYMRKTGLSSAEVAKLLSEETYLTSDEAVEMSIVDRKTEDTEELYVAASMLDNAHWIKNQPKMKTEQDLMKQKISAFKNKISDFQNRK